VWALLSVLQLLLAGWGGPVQKALQYDIVPHVHTPRHPHRQLGEHEAQVSVVQANAYVRFGMQRVVVIVAAVLFFKNPVTTQSMAFTGVALAGVFAYSQAKRIYGSIKMEKATS
jgi:Triose-phosphate Transporter family